MQDTSQFVSATAARQKHLAHEEVVALFKQYESSEGRQKIRVRNKLVEHNMRLVLKIANMYTRRSKNSPKAKLPIEDLVQEGSLGLIKAIDKFKHEKGFRFSTYATWWIRQAIGDAMASRKETIRVPGHAQRLNSQLIDKRAQFLKEFGVEPSAEELAEMCGTSASIVKATQQASKMMLSLSDPYGSQDSGQTKTLADTLVDQNPLPDEVMMREETLRAARKALDSLSPREAAVVRLRYGLLPDVSDSSYDVTQEEQEALERGETLK